MVRVPEPRDLRRRSGDQPPRCIVWKAHEQILVTPIASGAAEYMGTGLVLGGICQACVVDHLVRVRLNMRELGGDDASARCRGVDHGSQDQKTLGVLRWLVGLSTLHITLKHGQPGLQPINSGGRFLDFRDIQGPVFNRE
jgi:hypothetical protein